MRTKIGMVLAVVLALGAAMPASAGPLVVERDRSDNTYYFDYDPSTGEIGTESSSMVVRRRDPVAFVVYIREAPGEGDGAALKATFSLSLNQRRVVRYAGTFSVVVRDAAGAVVARHGSERKIVLRPQSGQRRARFAIPFDLEKPGLNYEAKAIFKSG